MDFFLSATVLRRRSCRLRDLGSTRWGKSMGSWQVCARTQRPCSRSASSAWIWRRGQQMGLLPRRRARSRAAGPGAAKAHTTSLYKVITNLTALQTTPNCIAWSSRARGPSKRESSGSPSVRGAGRAQAPRRRRRGRQGEETSGRRRRGQPGGGEQRVRCSQQP